MGDVTPVALARDIGDCLDMGTEARAIGAREIFGAAKRLVETLVRCFKAGSSGIRKLLFRRIDQMDKGALDSVLREAANSLLEPGERGQKIAEPDELAVLGDRR